MTDQVERLGKYQIDEIIGSGGMGVVYKGHDTRISRTVAIKTIHPHLLEGEMGIQLRKRFRREASLVGKLNHSNIITLYDYDDSGDPPYFVMEFIEGKEIKSLLNQGKLFSISDTLDIAIQALSGLSLAHAHGIVHRDIKPANLILLDNGSIKIADFGIARTQEPAFADDEKTQIAGDEKTQLGTVLGSPRYMSPEQYFGGAVDQRSDLYSMAIVLYEMATGRKAFTNDVASRPKEPLPIEPDKSNKLLYRLYKKVLTKALAIDPDERYQSADQMIKDLKTLSAQSESISQKQPTHSVAPIITGVTVATLAAITLSVYLFWTEKSEPLQPPEAMTPAPKPPIAETEPKEKTSQTTHPTSLKESDVTGSRFSIKNLNTPQDETISATPPVEKLEQKARQQHLSGQLITPPGDNAFRTYKEILNINPDNEMALNGLKRILNNILITSEQLSNTGNRAAAELLLRKAATLYPEEPKIMLLQQKLSNNSTGTNSVN